MKEFFKNKNKVFNLVSLVINLSIFTMVLYCLISYLGSSSELIGGGKLFRFYTNDSNIFLMIMCGIMVPYNVLNLIKDDVKVPLLISVIKLFATVTTTITFLVVIFFLGPTQGYGNMFDGASLVFLHGVCPILGIVTLLLFDPKQNIDFKFCLYNLIPTGCYTIAYLIMVKGFGVSDFYGFFFDGKYYLTVVIALVIFGGVFGLGYLYRFVINKFNKSNASENK